VRLALTDERTDPGRSHVRFSPNGRFVLAATLDSTVRLWNVIESKVVKTYTGHSNVKCVSLLCDAAHPRRYCSAMSWFVSHGRTYIGSGSEDGKLVLWDAQTRERVAGVEAHRGASASNPPC